MSPLRSWRTAPRRGSRRSRVRARVSSSFRSSSPSLVASSRPSAGPGEPRAATPGRGLRLGIRAVTEWDRLARSRPPLGQLEDLRKLGDVKILLVSQMYPGPEDPDLGVFVRGLEQELTARG